MFQEPFKNVSHDCHQSPCDAEWLDLFLAFYARMRTTGHTSKSREAVEQSLWRLQLQLHLRTAPTEYQWTTVGETWHQAFSFSSNHVDE